MSTSLKRKIQPHKDRERVVISRIKISKDNFYIFHSCHYLKIWLKVYLTIINIYIVL